MKTLLPSAIIAGMLFGFAGNAFCARLHDAAEIGDLNEVEKLVNAGANMKELNVYGQTALHLAACEGHTEVVKFFLDSGMDVNIKERENGLTPLHIAAAGGKTEVMKVLISRGADVNAKDKDNSESILHYAAICNKVKAVKLLIDNGAKVNAKAKSGRTPLDRALQYKSSSVVELLVKKGGHQ